MKIIYFPILIPFFICCFSHLAKAQETDSPDTTKIYRLRLLDGQQLRGSLLSLDADSLKFDFRGNELIFGTDEVERLFYVKNDNEILLIQNSKIIDAPGNLDLIVGDTTQLYLVKMSNGTQYFGFIMSLNDDELELLFKGNILFFDTRKVDQIYLVTEFEEIPVFRFSKLVGAESLILSETAHSLPKGKADYRTVGGLAHIVDVGATDNISFGGGAIIPVGILAKAKFTTKIGEKSRIGGGTMVLLSFIDEPMVIAYPYGNLTIGSRRKFFNFSVGSLINFDYLDEIVFFG